MFNQNDLTPRDISSDSPSTTCNADSLADAAELEKFGIMLLVRAKALLKMIENVPDQAFMPDKYKPAANEFIHLARSFNGLRTRRAQVLVHDWRNSMTHFVAYEVGTIEIARAALQYFVRQLDAFSPADFIAEDEVGIVDLVLLVNQQARAIRSRFPNRAISVQMLLGTQTIFAGSWPIIMCLHNLLLNADQASPPDTEIEIKLSERTLAEKELREIWNGENMESGAFVALSVTDRGCGIDENTRRELFHKSVTTKLNGSGTGLKYVAETVTRYHGGASIESDPQGTTVTMYFPLVPPGSKATP